MHRLGWFVDGLLGIALAVAIGVNTARAGDAGFRDISGEPLVEQRMQAFLQMVFWPSNQFGNTAASKGVQKPAIEKLGPSVRVRISASGYESFTRDLLSREAAYTGIDVVFLADSDKSETLFIEIAHYTDGTTPSDLKTCDAISDVNAQGEPRIHIIMDPLKTIRTVMKGGASFFGCLNRQTMKALGFGYDHDHPTVMSYAYSIWGLTEVDKMMLRTLYDPRVKPGMHWLGALAAARDVLVDNMIADGAPAVTPALGRQWVARFADLLIARAETGDVAFQTQLGFAYSGEAPEYLPQNLAAAYDWFHRAAEAGDLAAQNQVGEMLIDGRGVAANVEEGVRWLQLAASRSRVDAPRRPASNEDTFTSISNKPAQP